MNPFSSDPALSAALWMVVRMSMLVGLAAIVQAVIHRRSSAAARHLVWTLAIAGALVLPMLSLALPVWDVAIQTAPMPVADADPVAAAAAGPADAASSPAALEIGDGPVPSTRPDAAMSWSIVIPGVYAAGVLVVLMRLWIQRRSVRRLARGADDMPDTAWTRLSAECAAAMGVERRVRLLRSRERSMPMTFGTGRPAIVIPATADLWPDERRRAVVLHEMAHVARYDCLTQTLALAACAMYWFHPAAWWVARRLRIERELACDDRVIAAGTQARDYAGHLLEIAYSFGSHRAPALAVSMARPRQLESRLLAALDEARNRRVPTQRLRLAAAVIAAALVLPLASATPTVVAAESDAPSSPAIAPVEPQQPDVVGPHLKEVRSAFLESARRLVRTAAAAIGLTQDGLPGTWEIRPSRTPGDVQFRWVEVNSNWSSNLPVDRLEGLTPAQLTGDGGPVKFRLRRDAGTFTFEGVLRSGVGAGTFSFAPDANFPGELEKRGYARPTTSDQYQLARHDIGFAFVDELSKQGYTKPATSDLVRAGHHGVQADYLREMGGLGYRLGSLQPLIELRDHGVTSVYVREMAAAGFKGLSADELRNARDHGVSAEYVRGMRDAGYGTLTLKQAIEARDHGVAPEFVRALDAEGHRGLPLEQLIRVRDHGVSAEYAREMRQAGHSLSTDDLVRARDHGLSAKYARDVKALGYDRLSADDLITLRDHGVTVDQIRSATARAGTQLPVEKLKSLAWEDRR